MKNHQNLKHFEEKGWNQINSRSFQMLHFNLFFALLCIVCTVTWNLFLYILSEKRQF